jgi:hypothetical protein
MSRQPTKRRRLPSSPSPNPALTGFFAAFNLHAQRKWPSLGFDRQNKSAIALNFLMDSIVATNQHMAGRCFRGRQESSTERLDNAGHKWRASTTTEDVETTLEETHLYSSKPHDTARPSSCLLLYDFVQNYCEILNNFFKWFWYIDLNYYVF